MTQPSPRFLQIWWQPTKWRAKRAAAAVAAVAVAVAVAELEGLRRPCRPCGPRAWQSWWVGTGRTDWKSWTRNV